MYTFSPKNKSARVWVAVVALAVLAALLLWWFAASRPLVNPLWNWRTAATSTPPAEEGDNAAPAAGSPAIKLTRSTQDVRTLASKIAGTSQFNALLRATGVSAELSPKGTYTIFLPTNGAVGQLPGGTIANMTTAEKRRLVEYHIVSGKRIDVDAVTSGSAQALSRDTLNFSYGREQIPMVNSAIVIAAYEGKNGIIYLIDNVLLPPKRTGQ